VQAPGMYSSISEKGQEARCN